MTQSNVFETQALLYLNELYGYAYKLTKNKDWAEDLVQETYFKSLKKYREFEEPGKIKSLLFRICHNTFIDQYRNKKSGPKIFSMEDLNSTQEWHPESPASFSPDARLMSEALSDNIKAALEAIPVEWRETLLLKAIHEFNYEEISKITNVPIGTVASRLGRARTAIKKYLADHKDKGLEGNLILLGII